MNIFTKITESNSFLYIQMIAEENLPQAEGKAAEALKKIIQTNDLDEAWMIAYAYLGDEKKVEELKNWIAKKKKR